MKAKKNMLSDLHLHLLGAFESDADEPFQRETVIQTLVIT